MGQIEDFLFVLGYAALIFLAATFLYPDWMDEGADFAGGFQFRHV
ncbi:hypothetical protein [Roseovarius carneus]|nr:hypothetical protein [Roseovarius carneus]